jgi:hypothetical protein
MKRLSVATTALVILAFTVIPSGETKVSPMLGCLVCGEHGVADVIRNILLFMPFGAALGIARTRVSRALLIGAALSAAIELAQFWIPGRDSSVSDVVANTLGTTLGCLLPHVGRHVLTLDDRASALLTLLFAGLVCAVTASTGVLLRPAFPRSIYYGQWTPHLGHLATYRGRVLEAQLGDMPIPSTRLDSSSVMRRLLDAGAPLDVRAIAGPAVPKLASLVSVYDDSQREIFLLGPDRQDLVFRYRTRSTAWRLEQPDLRVPGALAAVQPGDTLRIAVWPDPSGYCLLHNGVRACRLGFTAGRGWSLLLFPRGLSRWFMRILDTSWIAALLVPVGFCAGRRAMVWAGLTLLVGLALMPVLLGLRPSPPWEWLGGLAGVLLGMWLRGIWLRGVALRPSAAS